jgi:hypothetical protein
VGRFVVLEGQLEEQHQDVLLGRDVVEADDGVLLLLDEVLHGMELALIEPVSTALRTVIDDQRLVRLRFAFELACISIGSHLRAAAGALGGVGLLGALGEVGEEAPVLELLELTAVEEEAVAARALVDDDVPERLGVEQRAVSWTADRVMARAGHEVEPTTSEVFLSTAKKMP